MSRAITLPATFILLSACAQDFELNVLQEPELDGDTGWVVDTGEPLDTGEPWEEETETPVEENPTESEPEEEEAASSPTTSAKDEACAWLGETGPRGTAVCRVCTHDYFGPVS